MQKVVCLCKLCPHTSAERKLRLDQGCEPVQGLCGLLLVAGFMHPSDHRCPLTSALIDLCGSRRDDVTTQLGSSDSVMNNYCIWTHLLINLKVSQLLRNT